ncbi:MAG: glutamine synthetase [Polyangiaceae bacterium]|nr:glutamine synthetase [Polyangiaceae bacterium]
MHSEDTLPTRGLERELGKRADTWTADDLAELVKARGIRLVSLMHVGADGWLKALDFVPRTRAHLCDIIEGGERADGSSLFAGTGIRPGASDILLRPRLRSAFVDPFAAEPTLVLLCAHLARDGTPLPQSPDTIVRRAHERFVAETGVELHALGEVEYFLGKRRSDADIWGQRERGYHATSPFLFGERLRRRAMTVLAEIGVPIKYAHGEVGYIPAADGDDTIWEQHEVELALAPLPEAAEGVLLTQWVLRNLGHADGLRVNFDPIVRQGHAGSGMHFHFSPVRDGQHLGGRSADGTLEGPAQWLIAGLVRSGGSLMAFGNRSDASFVRLGQAREAPSAVTWGEFDRSALVRLPILARTAAGRSVSPPTVEFRLPDGSAHPFYLLAGVAQAALAGRAVTDLGALLERSSAARARLDPQGAIPLPRSVPEIAAALGANREVLEAGGVFPPAMIDSLIAALEPR